MHHNVADIVISSFSRLRTGTRWQSTLGLTVCELVDDTAELPALRVSGAETGVLVWRELSPPDPHRIRVHNRQATAAVAEAGAVVDGGMGMRVLKSCVCIPAESEATVIVVPLGSRWWDEGPLRRSGWLEPVAMALMLQASLAEEPLASSATTALQSLSPFAMLIDVKARPYRAGGWLLEDDDGVVAGLVVEHTALAIAQPNLCWDDDLCEARVAPLRPVWALREDVEYRAIEAHLVDHGSAGRDHVLLPHGVCVADHTGVAAKRTSR